MTMGPITGKKNPGGSPVGTPQDFSKQIKNIKDSSLVQMGNFLGKTLPKKVGGLEDTANSVKRKGMKFAKKVLGD